MAKQSVEEIVTELGEPVAEALGYELVDVEYRKEGADWYLRCFIDSPNGIGLDECQKFSQAMEKELDEKDPVSGSYLLEISSPGLERPLKKGRDFVRFAGEMIEVKLCQPMEGQKKLLLKLVGFDEDSQNVKLEKNNSIVEIPLKNIAKANLSVDFFGGTGGKKSK